MDWQHLWNPFGEEEFEKNLNEKEPAWLLKLRRKAFERFKCLPPTPKRNNEQWRFSGLANIDMDRPLQLSKATGPPPLPSHPFGATSGQLHFGDSPSPAKVIYKQSAVFLDFQEALKEKESLLKDCLLSFQAKDFPGAENFLWLNLAFAKSGSLLYVPENVQVDQPFLRSFGGEEKQIFQLGLHLTILEKSASASLIEQYENPLETAKSQLKLTILKEKASFKAWTFQNQGKQTRNFFFEQICLHDKAKSEQLTLHKGGRYTRGQSLLRVMGQEAEGKLSALTQANKEQEFDLRTLQDHVQGKSLSKLLYKNTLEDKARSIFSGMIIVEENAQETDAYQTNRNLILSDNAEANSLPGLQIAANDVKCSHGATTGQVSAEELFYLQSRGLSKATAHQLMIAGFFEELIGPIPFETVREAARKLFGIHNF